MRGWLMDIQRHWIEIQPGNGIKALAHQLLLLHALSAADSLQLAAALLWADKLPAGHRFVCLDAKLCEAAQMEGFVIAP